MSRNETTLNLVDNELFLWMQDIRRHIHKHPELSFQEVNTAAYIREKLDEIGIHSVQTVAGTGIVAELGDTSQNHIVGLRADMDGLPIHEGTDLPFASVTPGVMHSCGHDGHIAMLLGAIAILVKQQFPGRVRIIFQPAEECGNGALKMVAEGVLKGLDMIFSGHIDTHYPTGSITVDEGIICAFADPFTISLQGKSGHAARPHEANDVIVAATSLVTSIQSLVSREVDPNHAGVVTIGSLHAGNTHNVIAEKAILEGTIRTTHPDARGRLTNGLKRMTEGTAALYDIQTKLEFENRLPAVINSKAAVIVAKKAAASVIPNEHILSQGMSSLGGEDFAFYLQELDGCMVRFGARKEEGAGPSHSSSFDFDETVLSTGASWYAAVAMQCLHESISPETP